MKHFRRLILAAAFGVLAGPAFGQGFSGPANIAQPTTAGRCVQVAPQGGNNLVQSSSGCGSSSAVGANPTATAGAAAVNGTSPNFMRADAAPALPIGTSGAAIPLLNGNNTWSGAAIFSTLPTSDPHVAGQLWNNAGVVQVSAG